MPFALLSVVNLQPLILIRRKSMSFCIKVFLSSVCICRVATKDPRSIYGDAGRLLARGVDPFMSVNLILYHGTKAPPVANDGANTVNISQELVSHSLSHANMHWTSLPDRASEERRHHLDVYQKVFAVIPGFKELVEEFDKDRTQASEDAWTELCHVVSFNLNLYVFNLNECVFQITSAQMSARSGDTSSLRQLLTYAVSEPNTPLSPALDDKSKGPRGLNHPVLRKLICPRKYLDELESHPARYAYMRIYMHKDSSNSQTFITQDSCQASERRAEDDCKELALILVRGRCIWCRTDWSWPSPWFPPYSSTSFTIENIYMVANESQCARRIFCGPTAGFKKPDAGTTVIFTPRNNGRLHGPQITPEMIAYCAVQVSTIIFYFIWLGLIARYRLGSWSARWRTGALSMGHSIFQTSTTALLLCSMIVRLTGLYRLLHGGKGMFDRACLSTTTHEVVSSYLL